jgi:hypothetical protein
VDSLERNFERNSGIGILGSTTTNSFVVRMNKANKTKTTTITVHILLPSSLFTFLSFFFLYKLCAIRSRCFFSCLSTFIRYTPSSQRSTYMEPSFPSSVGKLEFPLRILCFTCSIALIAKLVARPR